MAEKCIEMLEKALTQLKASGLDEKEGHEEILEGLIEDLKEDFEDAEDAGDDYTGPSEKEGGTEKSSKEETDESDEEKNYEDMSDADLEKEKDDFLRNEGPAIHIVIKAKKKE